MSYDPPGAASGVPVYTNGVNAMAADLDLGTHKILNVVNPATDQQAATKKYVDDAIVAGGGYTDEQAQDAVGTILADTTTVNLTYTDATPEIKADVLPGGIKLDDLAAPDDTTDLDVSTSLHGLVPKITGSDGYVLTKSSTAAVWSAAASGGATLAQSKLAGRGSASGSGVYEEIALGTNLSMSGTTLNASGGGSGATAQDFIDATWNKKFWSDASLLPATERVAATLATVTAPTVAAGSWTAGVGSVVPGSNTLVYWDMGAARSTMLGVICGWRAGGAQDCGLFFTSSAPANVDPDGFMLQWDGTNYKLFKRASGAYTQLGSSVAIAFTSAHGFGMAFYYDDSSNTLSGFGRTAGTWFRIITLTDTSFTTMRYFSIRVIAAATLPQVILPVTVWSD